ncbi:MAG: c-type cytochrome, partial [Casimicrobiaceae bacterium]
LPNRNGMTSAHGMWDVDGKPDTANTACMKNCEGELKVHSSIPDYARNAHGNLAQQMREIGGVRGVDTTQPAPTTLSVAGSGAPVAVQSAQFAAAAVPNPAVEPLALATKQGCLACHGVDKKLVGPGFREVATRYRTSPGAGSDKLIAQLAGKIRTGSSGAWGSIPMPPQAQVSMANAEILARWIAAGAPAR